MPTEGPSLAATRAYLAQHIAGGPPPTPLVDSQRQLLADEFIAAWSRPAEADDHAAQVNWAGLGPPWQEMQPVPAMEVLSRAETAYWLLDESWPTGEIDHASALRLARAALVQSDGHLCFLPQSETYVLVAAPQRLATFHDSNSRRKALHSYVHAQRAENRFIALAPQLQPWLADVARQAHSLVSEVIGTELPYVEPELLTHRQLAQFHFDLHHSQAETPPDNPYQRALDLASTIEASVAVTAEEPDRIRLVIRADTVCVPWTRRTHPDAELARTDLLLLLCHEYAHVARKKNYQEWQQRITDRIQPDQNLVPRHMWRVAIEKHDTRDSNQLDSEGFAEWLAEAAVDCAVSRGQVRAMVAESAKKANRASHRAHPPSRELRNGRTVAMPNYYTAGREMYEVATAAAHNLGLGKDLPRDGWLTHAAREVVSGEAPWPRRLPRALRRQVNLRVAQLPAAARSIAATGLTQLLNDRNPRHGFVARIVAKLRASSSPTAQRLAYLDELLNKRAVSNAAEVNRRAFGSIT